MSGTAPGDVTSDAAINARIDRLPGWSLPKLAFVILGFAYFIDIYDTGVIGYSLPVLIEEFRLTSFLVGVLVTGTVITTMVGAYLFASAADAFGRQRTLFICLALLAATSLLTALSWSAAALLAFRTLSGFALGGVTALVTAYLVELSPVRNRGTFMSYTVWWTGVAVAATPFVAFAVVPISDIGWRILYGLGAIAVLPMLLVRRPWIPESPRWLAARGRGEEASRIVDALEDHARRSGEELPELPDVPADEPTRKFPTVALLRPPYLQRLLVVLLFWFGLQFSVRATFTFQPTILTEFGLTLQSSTLLLGIGALAAVVGYTVMPFIVERFERRTLIVSGLGLAILSPLMIAATSGNPAIVVVGAALTQFAGAVIFVPAWTYTAEVFPTPARASGASLASGLGMVGGITQSVVLVAAMAAAGPQTAMLLLAPGYVIALAVFGLLAIRTTGRSLTTLSGGRTEPAKVESPGSPS